MSVVFTPKAARLRLREFYKDRSGIVTVQMVMFSVFIFGGIGLMMDFGRAYSAHSQMQGYIDQVALAAAQQLDGKDNSIIRAQNAANAVTKNSGFITDSSFSLKSLTFMTDAPTDANGDFSPTLAATFNTQEPTIAKYVLAIASTSSVSVKLLNFGRNGTDRLTDIKVAASAVATSRTVSCGGLSPIVMCNPFEHRTTTSWEEEMKNGIGYRMKLTANNTDGSKPNNLDSGRSQIQLGLLKSPDTLMEVRNTVCNTTTNLPGYDTSSASTETLKDMCLLATVEAGLSCVNEQVAYKAAHPATLTTGLDVIFDMYDDEMAEILDQSQDISFPHSFPASMGFPSTITRSSLFYPDAVPSHGRMTREDYAQYLDNRYHEVNSSPIPPFFKTASFTAISNERTAYGPDAALDPSSRQNHVFDIGKRSEWGPAQVRTCLNVENCDSQQGSPYPTIYNAKPSTDTIKNYASWVYHPYLRQEVQATNPSSYPNWWDTPAGVQDSTDLVQGHDTYYGFYSEVERANTDLHVATATMGHRRSDSSGAPIDIVWNGDADGNGVIEYDQDDQDYGTTGIQTGAINFPAAYSASAIGNEERRVQRVTVVNCEAAQSYETVTGDDDAFYSDTYMGEVVDVIDVFMLTPPQVTECNPIMSNDPQSNNLCPNAEIVEAHLDVELVDAASINSVNFDARFYAVLVH